MGLKITLRPKERMIVGSAVIANAGTSECSISVENNATILREKNIMKLQEADTPCRQIYFIVQMMYVDPQRLSHHHKNYWKLVREVIHAAPSTLPMIHKINQDILNDGYYQAMKTARQLIAYESTLLNAFTEDISGSKRRHA
jgi:flagellar biosynthesis repressor protein FlbT